MKTPHSEQIWNFYAGYYNGYGETYLALPGVNPMPCYCCGQILEYSEQKDWKVVKVVSTLIRVKPVERLSFFRVCCLRCCSRMKEKIPYEFALNQYRLDDEEKYRHSNAMIEHINTATRALEVARMIDRYNSASLLEHDRSCIIC